jgi:uncharacterized UBP type Zn finger protein
MILSGKLYINNKKYYDYEYDDILKWYYEFDDILNWDYYENDNATIFAYKKSNVFSITHTKKSKNKITIDILDKDIYYQKKYNNILNKEKMSINYVGIQNIGNSCFFSAMIQFLYGIDYFRNYILYTKRKFELDKNMSHNYFFMILKNLFYAMYENNKETNELVKFF